MSDYKREPDETFDGDRMTHPSYGQISISRSSSSRGINLYGSNIKHGNVITLEINESEHVRHLHRDSYFTGGQLIEVNMSSAQFTELITTLNVGSGTPCTIKRVQGNSIEECPQYSAKQEFDNEFKDDLKSLSKIVDESLIQVRDMLKGSSVKKGDLREVDAKLTKLKQQIASNIPFLADQFTKHTDKTVSTAKSEIDAMLTHVITQTGLKHLNKEDILKISD